ncbi:MAG TPA: SAM-dependent methyltransferase [Candidatus Limnocylindrales bacterium]|nr:SAM-dependent methyltransferase [Candidatus Limnocylindrales bacterium]
MANRPLIRNISDTARWVAVYRARETERPDALFRDPYARRLAGERGEEIAVAMGARSTDDWPFTIRTLLFDSYITEHVRNGCDLVVNLAAGLDTRPYRMDLPASLRWVEVDLPEIFDYKEEALAGEKPRCSLSRVRLDLANREARCRLFAELGRDAGNALIVTEGLIVYLESQQAAALAEDLAAPAGFRSWIIDLMSPGLRRMIMRRIGSLLEEARAPLRFSPEEGPDVFLPQGWRPIEVRSFLKWAARKKRVGFGMRLLAMLPASNGRQGSRPWAAACLLGRAD